MERWKSVVGTDGDYEVSTLGRVRSWTTGRARRAVPRVLVPYGVGPTRAKYPAVAIRGKSMKVHRLVMLVFVGMPPKGMQVNHIDGNKLNSRLDNLEYVTGSDNCKHAFAIGLVRPMRGEANPRAKLSESDVRGIRSRKTRPIDEAQEFGVSSTLIINIRKGRVWKHV